MKLIHLPSQRRVQFLPQTLPDYAFLGSFPALVKVDGHYYCTDKAPVIANVLKRVPESTIVQWDIPGGLIRSERLKDLSDDFVFYTDPLRHQLIALRFLITNRGGGLLLDPGLGKTKVCLDFAAYMKFQRVLVVCPKALMFVWEDEVFTHRPDLSYTSFKTTEWEDHADLDRTLWIINYRKAVLLRDKLKKIKFDAIFIDEGLVKNPSSEQTKALNYLSRKIPYRVIMSGTLVNNSEIDLFSPVQILEPSLVGTSFTKFRDEYFHVWSPDKDNENIKITSSPKDKEMLKSILHSCSLVMRKEQWLDLPEKEFIEVGVRMPAKASHHYYELMSNYITDIDGTCIEVDNPLSAMCKLMQISNGFIYEKNEDFTDYCLSGLKKKGRGKNRPVYYFEDQPKVEALRSLLEGDLRREKFVLWYVMDAERNLLETLLQSLGVAFQTIAGGEKDVRSKVSSFNDEEGGIQVLLCQAKTLNYGVTLLGNQDESEDDDEAPLEMRLNPAVHTQVFFSLTFSLEVFLQQQDRIHRIGQTRACKYYLLISDSPIEQMLVDKLKNKMEIRNFMLEDIFQTCREKFLYEAG